MLLPIIGVAQQYNFHNYSVKDGISQSQVYCMLQDNRGYLWMGTRGGGITVFDGINFKILTTKEGLPNNNILSIKQSKNGHIWIGTNNGLSEYDGISFKNYKVLTDENVSFYDMDFDEHQNLWIASNKGLLQFINKKFINILYI